jgi:hypothetical protein
MVLPEKRVQYRSSQRCNLQHLAGLVLRGTGGLKKVLRLHAFLAVLSISYSRVILTGLSAYISQTSNRHCSWS